MEEEIKSEFRHSGFDLHQEQEILNKCLTFCINYTLTPSDLVSTWEAYYLNRQLNDPIVQNAEMDGFLLHLQNVKKETIIKEETGLHSYSIRDVEMTLNNDDETNDNTPGTPADHHQDIYSTAHDTTHLTYRSVLSSGKPSTLVTPFSKRADRFAVKFSINTMPDVENGKLETNHENAENDEDDVIRKFIPRKRCSLVIRESGPKPGCIFLYDRTGDKINAMENRIRKHTRALVASGLYEEPTDPTVASQTSIFAVGMICCDGEGRLNEKSIMLQSRGYQPDYSGGEEISRTAADGKPIDRMSRLANHILSQRSFYPLYPPAESVAVDLSLAPEALQLIDSRCSYPAFRHQVLCQGA